MKIIMLLCCILLAAPALAKDYCGDRLPPEQRSRVVECTDGSFAIQCLSLGGTSGAEWISAQCGLSKLEALKERSRVVLDDTMDDVIACPRPEAQIKMPVVVIEW
jgi:hypothetical protein